MGGLILPVFQKNRDQVKFNVVSDYGLTDKTKLQPLRKEMIHYVQEEVGVPIP